MHEGHEYYKDDFFSKDVSPFTKHAFSYTVVITVDCCKQTRGSWFST